MMKIFHKKVTQLPIAKWLMQQLFMFLKFKMNAAISKVIAHLQLVQTNILSVRKEIAVSH